MADGTLKVENIQTSSGSGTITLGQSGETVAFGSGVTSNLLYPAFRASMSASQDLTDDTRALVQYDTVDYDTDSAYDNSAGNYKFTIPSGKAGKYIIYAQAYGDAQAATQNSHTEINIYKNGSLLTNNETIFTANYIQRTTQSIITTFDLAVADYIQIYMRVNDTSGNPRIYRTSTNQNWFGAYRIGA
jgi:hypothetical protein